MAQARSDRPPKGGKLSTAGGRAHALAARGFNEVAAVRRAYEVARLRHVEHLTFRRIGEELGISTSQAWRDYQSLILAAADREAKSWR
jgi:hypothetical protein